MTAVLAEPVVLAAAKDAIYPEIRNHPQRYAVTDTQFSVGSWGGWTVPESIHDRLMPFNSIRLHSGEPDLLGVGMPAVEVLDDDAASTPVVAVEAKDTTRRPKRRMSPEESSRRTPGFQR